MCSLLFEEEEDEDEQGEGEELLGLLYVDT